MSTEAKLGNALYDGLVSLRKQKGELKMEDVGTLFEQISATLHSPENVLERGFVKEIEKLANYIRQTKNEISVMAAAGGSKDRADGAVLHLDAVIKATEEAGHTIMDAVDTIQTAAASVPVEAQTTINQAVTKIYEACNFQDIACQRLGKVIKMLDEVDAHVNNVLKLFSGQSIVTTSAASQKDSLLNGPQLPDQAPSQADIDALFSEIKP